MSETITTGGEDITATDAEARDIMAHLVDTRGLTEERVARTPYRILVNLVLKAQGEIKASATDDVREFHGEDGSTKVSINRRHVIQFYFTGSGHTKNGPYDERVLLDKIDVTLRPDPEFDIKEIVTILCAAHEFKEWVTGTRTE